MSDTKDPQTRTADLTEAVIRDLLPEATRYTVKDAKQPGLYLRVSPNGIKAWSVVLRVGRKVRRLSPGKWPAVSSRRARKFAQDAAGKASQGQDPTQPLPSTVTVGDAFTPLSERSPWTAKVLRRDVLPLWRDLPVAGIQRADVAHLLDGVVERARGNPAATAGGARAFNTCRTALVTFFNYAAERGLCEGNPAKAIRPMKTHSKDRVLSPTEIVTFWRGLALAPGGPDIKNALRLALLTACRIGEVCGATRAEVDLVQGVWRLPPERTKSERAHEVPLSTMALAVVQEQQQRHPHSPFLFPGRGSGKGLDTSSPVKVLRQSWAKWKVPPFTAHDLRRTAATAMADLGVPYRTVQDCLNHSRGGVTAVYVRTAPLELKREALQKWADHITALLEKESTTPAE